MIDALIDAFYVWVVLRVYKFIRFIIWLARLSKAQLWYFLGHMYLTFSDGALDLVRRGLIERDSWLGRGLKRAAVYSGQTIRRKFAEIEAERESSKNSIKS
jgi:hypothetical protein